MGVKDRGRVVHYLWASPPGTEVRLLWGLNYAVAEDEWYVWDVLTDPEFRNRGLMQKSLKALRSQFASDESIILAAKSTNAPSIAAIQRAGFTIMKTYGGILLLRRLFIIRYAPELRVGLGHF